MRTRSPDKKASRERETAPVPETNGTGEVFVTKYPVSQHQASTQPLRKKRRSRIVASAVKIFVRKGFHQSTIKEIASDAGISTGLVYQYVEDKEELLLLVLLEIARQWRREIPAALAELTDPIERFKVVITSYAYAIDASIEGTHLAYRETKSLRADRRQLLKNFELEDNKIISNCIEECVQAGLFYHVNNELTTYQIVMFVHAWALKHWRFKEIVGLDDYIEHGLNFFLRALMVRDPGHVTSAPARQAPRGKQERRALKPVKD